MFRRLFFVLFSLFFAVIFSFAQSRLGHQFSREETVEILLDKSKKENIKGFVALGGGMALSGVGIHFLRKDPYEIGNNGSTLTVSESDNHVLGACLLGLGVTSILTSPFLFIHAGRLKHKAKLLLSDESTSFLNKKISVPSAGIQIDF